MSSAIVECSFLATVQCLTCQDITWKCQDRLHIYTFGYIGPMSMYLYIIHIFIYAFFILFAICVIYGHARPTDCRICVPEAVVDCSTNYA